MADTIRQQIMAALKTRLDTISTANGYETDATVYEWHVTDVSSDDLPVLDIRDSEQVTAAAVQEDEHTITGEITALAAGSASAAASAVRNLIGDTVKAIGTDVTFGGLAQDTQIDGDVITIDHEDKRIAGATITVRIIYTTPHMNPFSN